MERRLFLKSAMAGSAVATAIGARQWRAIFLYQERNISDIAHLRGIDFHGYPFPRFLPQKI
jgi:formate dehydrogenase assembly factor FdhD